MGKSKRARKLTASGPLQHNLVLLGPQTQSRSEVPEAKRLQSGQESGLCQEECPRMEPPLATFFPGHVPHSERKASSRKRGRKRKANAAERSALETASTMSPSTRPPGTVATVEEQVRSTLAQVELAIADAETALAQVYRAQAQNPSKSTGQVSSPHELRSGPLAKKKGKKTTRVLGQSKTLPVRKQTKAPQPSKEYLAQASQLSRTLSHARELLLVIDLNGTLLYRPKLGSSFIPRPYVDNFIRYVLSTFQVMIWSSSRPENVEKMCRQIFTPEQLQLVIAQWGRDRLGLTPFQYDNKVQVYKDLSKVWDAPEVVGSHPQHVGGVQWDQSNTVLLDDSALKAASHPFNIVEVPEFLGNQSYNAEMRARPLEQVMNYLEVLRTQGDVSAFMRDTPFQCAEQWNGESPKSETKLCP
ncbi:MAG: hypothetical protein M1833_005430 [Piccolia ochrophora]|nr:MAG: hypothetical protein M1833_005430 [Piccolia ochrophora]